MLSIKKKEKKIEIWGLYFLDTLIHEVGSRNLFLQGAPSATSLVQGTVTSHPDSRSPRSTDLSLLCTAHTPFQTILCMRSDRAVHEGIHSRPLAAQTLSFLLFLVNKVQAQYQAL